MRAEANPVSRPCQKGELADWASSCVRWERSLLAASIARSGSFDRRPKGTGRLGQRSSQLAAPPCELRDHFGNPIRFTQPPDGPMQCPQPRNSSAVPTGMQS